jgi:hypothetical protein
MKETLELKIGDLIVEKFFFSSVRELYLFVGEMHKLYSVQYNGEMWNREEDFNEIFRKERVSPNTRN